MIKKYVDHGRNGLYLTELTTNKLNLEKIDSQLILEISADEFKEKEILEGIELVINTIEDDNTKKITYNFKAIVKQMCEENLFIHSNIVRSTTLAKFFKKDFKWNTEDKSELFLKVCERMYNKIDYNFVICVKRRNGLENIITFRDHTYLEYISNLGCDTYIQIIIDNINSHDTDNWVRKVEEMYYEVDDFSKRLNNLIKEFLETPGILFKKLKNGIPFGLWLVSQFIDTGDSLDISTRQRLGQIFFERSDIFN